MTPKKLLKELKEFDLEKYNIVSTLRNLVMKDKQTNEEVKYGGLYYSLEKPYTGIFVSKKHVSMEFSNGAKLEDPDNLLQGSGKQRRHLKFTSVNEIPKAKIATFLKQAKSL